MKRVIYRLGVSGKKSSRRHRSSRSRGSHNKKQRGGESDIFVFIEKTTKPESLNYADFKRRFGNQFGRKKHIGGDADVTPIMYAFLKNTPMFYQFIKHVPEMARESNGIGDNLVGFLCTQFTSLNQSTLVDIIDTLGKEHADLTHANNEGLAPLHASCQRLLNEVALKILSYGANESALSHVTKKGFTPLMFACMSIFKSSMVPVIKKIYSFGAEEAMVGYANPSSGVTAFLIGCSIRSNAKNDQVRLQEMTLHEDTLIEMLNTYSANEWNVKSTAKGDLSVLILCCINRLYRVVNRILDFDAEDINLAHVDKSNNNTVLLCVCLHGYKEEEKDDDLLYQSEILITELTKTHDKMDAIDDLIKKINGLHADIEALKTTRRNERSSEKRRELKKEIHDKTTEYENLNDERVEMEYIVTNTLSSYNIGGASFSAMKKNLSDTLTELKKGYDKRQNDIEKKREKILKVIEPIALKIVSFGADACNLYHRAVSNDPKSSVYYFAMTRGMNELVYEIDRMQYPSTIYKQQPSSIVLGDDDTIFDPIMMEDVPITDYIGEEENADKVVIQFNKKSYIISVNQIRNSVTTAKRYACKSAGSYNDENIDRNTVLFDTKKVSDMVLDGSVLYTDIIHIEPKKNRYYVLKETSQVYPTFIGASIMDATKTVSLVSMTHCNAGAGGKVYCIVPAMVEQGKSKNTDEASKKRSKTRSKTTSKKRSKSSSKSKSKTASKSKSKTASKSKTRSSTKSASHSIPRDANAPFQTLELNDAIELFNTLYPTISVEDLRDENPLKELLHDNYRNNNHYNKWIRNTHISSDYKNGIIKLFKKIDEFDDVGHHGLAMFFSLNLMALLNAPVDNEIDFKIHIGRDVASDDDIECIAITYNMTDAEEEDATERLDELGVENADEWKVHKLVTMSGKEDILTKEYASEFIKNINNADKNTNKLLVLTYEDDDGRDEYELYVFYTLGFYRVDGVSEEYAEVYATYDKNGDAIDI